MKNGKRLIAGLLAAVMTISSVQMTAYAAEEEVIESETEVVEEADADETVADDKADETVVADEADDIVETVETQTVAAEVSDDTDVDEEETVAVMATIEDTDEEIVADTETVTETVTTETVTSEDIETVVTDEATEQVSDEETVETEVQEFDIDVTANASVDYDAVEKYVHDQLLEKFNKNPKAETITVDVSSYKIPLKSSEDSKKLENIYCMYAKDDLFFLKQKSMPTLDYPNGILLKLTYKIDTEKDWAAFEKAVNEALSHVNDSMSDFQKLAVLHDWLARHCDYDLSAENKGSLYGALVDKRATCQGISQAYKYLLDQVDIECYYAECKSVNHVWNLVKLDGNYYHIDVAGPCNCHNKEYQILHRYFLDSDERRHGYGYSEWKICTTTRYDDSLNFKATSTLYDDAPWKNQGSPFNFEDESVVKTYTITYVLNGGTNNSENPVTYYRRYKS